MKKLTPDNKLDIVLKYLVNPPDEPAITAKELYEDIKNSLQSDNVEIMLILHKLIKDGYVRTFDSPIALIRNPQFKYTRITAYYIITFDGKYFITEMGGYHQKHQDIILARDQLRIANKRSIMVNTWLVIGANVSGFAATGLLIWETRHLLLRLWHFFFC
jgi:hypothetical protein